MADGRTSKRSSSDVDADVKHKKAKTNEAADDKKNPYLAHMYEEENGNGNGNGVAARFGGDDPFAHFTPRQTTAKEAEDVEDLDYNAFTGRQHSKRYFDILRSRRDLPVHKQR